MSKPIVCEDSIIKCLEATPTSAKVLKFYKDKEGTIESTKMLGKYCKETTYSFEKVDPYLLSPLEDDLMEDDDPTNTVDWLLDDPNIEILSVSETYPNKSYNPQEWRRIYDAKVKYIAKAEKETGFHVY